MLQAFVAVCCTLLDTQPLSDKHSHVGPLLNAISRVQQHNAPLDGYGLHALRTAI
jgi:hypothetical protein